MSLSVPEARSNTEQVIHLAHHQKIVVGTELSATKFQPLAAVKDKPQITHFAPKPLMKAKFATFSPIDMLKYKGLLAVSGVQTSG